MTDPYLPPAHRAARVVLAAALILTTYLLITAFIDHRVGPGLIAAAEHVIRWLRSTVSSNSDGS
jgi:hypothetical protein